MLIAAGLNGGLTTIYMMNVLGADILAIGLLGSISAAVSAVLVLVGGWMGDRYSKKKMFLLGTGLTMFNPLIYALAPSWHYLIIAAITGSINMAIAGPVGFSIRVFSVERRYLTKATAALYTTHAITNMIVPPIGATVVVLAGGLQSLRQIYIIQSVIEIVAWIYTAKKLKVKETDNINDIETPKLGLRGFFTEFIDTYKTSRREGTWGFLLLAATSPWVFSIDGSFQNIYAEKVCQSPLIVIGLLSTISSIVALVLYIPIANIAEKKGRMDMVAKIRPFQYMGQILCILAGTFYIPSVTPYLPLAVWGLRSAGGVGGPGWEVASIEAIPLNRLAKWQALQNFVSRVSEIPVSTVGALLWNLDPRAPLIWHLVFDIVFRMNIIKMIAKTQAQKKANAN